MAHRAAPRIKSVLTARQELILCKVVDDYLQTGQPVASRSLAADPELDCGPSTIRNELSLLEEHGLLAHPHVSAGRVPTDAGHRYVVDRMLASGQGPLPARRLELSLIRREVEEAMRATTETLSQVTNLLAVVSAPAMHTATIRHIEVLALQPQVVMVVIITSTGGVSKMLADLRGYGRSGARGVGGGVFERAARRSWARGAHAPPALGRPEPVRYRAGVPRAFGRGLQRDLLRGRGRFCIWMEQRGSSSAGQIQDTAQINELMGLLERRVALLAMLRAALGESGSLCADRSRERDPRDALARPGRDRAMEWRGASWAPCR